MAGAERPDRSLTRIETSAILICICAALLSFMVLVQLRYASAQTGGGEGDLARIGEVALYFLIYIGLAAVSLGAALFAAYRNKNECWLLVFVALVCGLPICFMVLAAAPNDGEVLPRGLQIEKGDALLALPGLCKELDGADGSVHFSAASELYAIAKAKGTEAHEASQALTRALTHENKNIRELAVEALGCIGPGALSSAPELKEYAKRNDGVERIRALQSLWQVTGDNTEVVEGLINLMADPNPRVRLEAIEVIAKIGQPARRAMPALRKALEDPEESIRRTAYETQFKIK